MGTQTVTLPCHSAHNDMVKNGYTHNLPCIHKLLCHVLILSAHADIRGRVVVHENNTGSIRKDRRLKNIPHRNDAAVQAPNADHIKIDGMPFTVHIYHTDFFPV